MRPRGRRRPQVQNRGPRKNHQIRVTPIRVIDEHGENLGEMDTNEALKLAKSRGLDLVEIGAKSNPPICKIVDYGKWKYEQDKGARLKRQRSKTVKSEVKGIRITFGAGEHDLGFRAKQAREFLEAGHMVRVEMRLRGREKGKIPFAKGRMHEFLTLVDIPVKIQQQPKKGGRGLEMLIIRDKQAILEANRAQKTQKSVTPAPQQPQDNAETQNK